MERPRGSKVPKPKPARPPGFAYGIELNRITITFELTMGAKVALPIVELQGRALTGNPRLDAVSSATIKTTHMTPAGLQFIDDMAQAFGMTDVVSLKPKAS